MSMGTWPKRVSSKRIKRCARGLRKLYFKSLDFFGDRVFHLLRLLGAVPRKSHFEKKDVKKILIIRIDRIGDVLLSTPAIRAVKESFPKAEVHLLVTGYTQDLVINNPHINKLLGYRKDKIGDDYDLAIALHPGFKQNYITFMSGARYRVGYEGQGGGVFLTDTLMDDRETRIRHEVESALEVVARVGCQTGNKSLEISVTREGERFAEHFFKKNQIKTDDRVIIMHPGARQEYIRWKKEGFAEVADQLIRCPKSKVILIGGDGEGPLLKEVASLMETRPLLALGLKLTQLVSLIKRGALFIGNSTGPMHIAAALKVPVVAIFGNTHPLDSYQEWGPWGKVIG